MYPKDVQERLIEELEERSLTDKSTDFFCFSDTKFNTVTKIQTLQNKRNGQWRYSKAGKFL